MKTPCVNEGLWIATCIAAWMLCMGGMLVGQAYGQEAPGVHSHEGVRGAFIQKWNRPYSDYGADRRSRSCCGENDCKPVTVTRKGGSWWFFDGERNRVIPEHLLEHNQEDAEESPTGESIVCFNNSIVYCAVIGSGQ